MSELKFHFVISQVVMQNATGGYEVKPAWAWKQISEFSAVNAPLIKDAVVFSGRDEMLVTLSEAGWLNNDQLRAAFNDYIHHGFHSAEVWIPKEKTSSLIPQPVVEPGLCRPSAKFRELLERFNLGS